MGEDERTKRELRIDPRLKAAGWEHIVRFTPGLDARSLTTTAIDEYETSLGPAAHLLSDGRRLLSVVEAKKLTVGAQGVLPHAERYVRVVDSELGANRCLRVKRDRHRSGLHLKIARSEQKRIGP